jgi:hypothetical protein
MVDKSHVELNAIHTAFEGKVAPLLCDFHRLQAWNRWLTRSDNGVGSHRKKFVFKAMIQIADAKTVEEFKALVQAFQDLPDYKSNQRLQHYFKNEWLSCEELWAACYRQVGYSSTIDAYMGT